MVQDSEKNVEIMDEIEVPIEFIEGKIENYSTEPSISYRSEEFQSIDECKTIDLQDKQEMEECIVSKTVKLPDIPIRDIEEQEVEEVVSDVILPEMCSTKENLCTDKLKLEVPKINAVEICKMPSETKSEMPMLEEPSEPKLETSIIKETSIMQSESKLIQDMALISDVPTPFHNHAQPMTKWEISVSNKTILSKLKTHTRHRNI